nr:RES domain-containing protein [Mycolicibacter kumamotonensis]
MWRVGYHATPLEFTPLELYSFSHRFDIHHRFRTLYLADMPETASAKCWPTSGQISVPSSGISNDTGLKAAEDFAAAPVTASWRRQHVLVPALLRIDGPIIDLTDGAVRQEIEDRHAPLLVENGMEHLDLHEITTSRRVVTQTIAGVLYDRGVAAVRFLSRLDAEPCVALFEGRGDADLIGETVALTDPAPDPLRIVTTEWNLDLETCPA